MVFSKESSRPCRGEERKRLEPPPRAQVGSRYTYLSPASWNRHVWTRAHGGASTPAGGVCGCLLIRGSPLPSADSATLTERKQTDNGPAPRYPAGLAASISCRISPIANFHNM
ncbi:hypothetical protein EVAR_52052_1 [Eumeta japonica]|uniref:Uncharacterized protein n=1 Tax=Eumeta variegata TaxID=151549 RepID=A0A4C1Z3B6_EUMVA|nr:hypothetical protein EVAR_52052_1 [Eumeta japonica]